MPTPKNDFTQRRRKREGAEAKGRVWVWDTNPRISIRERINASGGIGFRVTFPKQVTGGRVLHLQSCDFEEAKGIARSRGREFLESRSTARVLGDAEKIQAAAALRTLKSAKMAVTLDRMASDFVSAAILLDQFGVNITEGARLLARSLTKANEAGKPLDELLDYACERLKPKGGERTVEQLADELIEIKRVWQKRGDLRPASLRDFENRAGRIGHDLGQYLLAELTKDRIQAWLSGLKRSPRTLKNYRMVLAEMMRYAVQKRYLVENPISELTRHDIKEIEGIANTARQPSILSPEQAEQLLLAAFADPAADLGPAVVLGLFAGIRTEELKRLKWDAVRLAGEQPFVVIGPEIAKKRRIRNVSLPPNAIAWLQRWPGAKEGALTRSGHINDFQKRFAKLSAAAGITWEANAMRHSFGSYHFALLSNSLETARLLGHKQDDTVLFAHYRALASKEQGEAYFTILPPKVESGVIPFPSQAG